MHLSQLLMQMKHFFRVTFTAFTRSIPVLCGNLFCSSLLDLEILNLLLCLGKFLLKLQLSALRVIKLMLEDSLFRFELFLVLLSFGQLLIFHIFDLVLEITKLALFVL